MASDPGPTVADQLHEQMEHLTSAERKVARAILADYPASALGSAQALGQSAGVSAPTVVRLATSIGFAGFSDMQAYLRSEISTRVSSPVLRTLAQGATHQRRSQFSQSMRRRSATIEETLRLLPHSEFDAACDLIAGCRKRLVVTGGFFSASLAQILALQLAQVHSGVVFAEEPLRRDAGYVLDARRGSVFVILDLRRYESAALTLAQHVRTKGGRVVLLTDRWMSPVAEEADVVLPVEVEETPFDTFVALLAVIEALVECVMSVAPDHAIRRMKQWEDAAVAHTHH